MVPHPVMLGFVNGLAIVIGLAQLGSLKTLSPAGELFYLAGQPLFLMLVLVAATMAIIWLLPKMTQAIPASLAAILVVTLASVAINHSMENPDGGNVLATVGDLVEINVLEVPQYHVATDRLA
jgi:sulfate permease, SulP family